jgi:hypothetical protein
MSNCQRDDAKKEEFLFGTSRPYVLTITFPLAILFVLLLGTTHVMNAASPQPFGRPAPGARVCGTINTDTHWSLAGSPYRVTCNVEVAKGIDLIVDPGVTVLFALSTQLTVHGNLQAEGTATQPITFTSGESTPAPGDWTRIWFPEDHGTSTLAHVVLEYAGSFGASSIHLSSGSLTLRDSMILTPWLWKRGG